MRIAANPGQKRENEVIQYEPATTWDSELVGLAGAIGIKKGKEFKDDRVEQNADGSFDIYFGPKAPEGQENNWSRTHEF